jgi:hypothetical protein
MVVGPITVTAGASVVSTGLIVVSTVGLTLYPPGGSESKAPRPSDTRLPRQALVFRPSVAVSPAVPRFPGRAAAFLAVLDADLARDHLMPESGDDRGRPGPSARSRLVSAGARSHGGSDTLLPVEW